MESKSVVARNSPCNYVNLLIRLSEINTSVTYSILSRMLKLLENIMGQKENKVCCATSY